LQPTHRQLRKRTATHATIRRRCKRLLREDIKKVDEPQLKAMFETSAEVLGGLRKAFQDYEQKNAAMG